MDSFLRLLIEKVKKPFQQGLEIREIFFAVIIGLLLTIFPIIGVTSLLITGAAIYFNLNLPIMLLLSFIAAPLQILLLMPFIRLGQTILRIEHNLLNSEQIKISFRNSIPETLKDLSLEIMCAIFAWLIIAVPIALVLLYILNIILDIYNETNQKSIRRKNKH